MEIELNPLPLDGGGFGWGWINLGPPLFNPFPPGEGKYFWGEGICFEL